jgi:uncharacterized glyoxalase superfamily protein PhnB
MITKIIPVLVYASIPAAHDFLVEAFGFTSGGVDRDPAGNAVHAEVRAGGNVIWLHRVTSEHQMAPPLATEFASSGLVVHVDNLDEHYKNARARGAQIENEPIDRPYGQREYGARDPEGHRWWFASPLPTPAQAL